MTTRRGTLILPSDIIGVEYECSYCNARYSVSLEFADRLVTVCPNCKEPWINSETTETSTYSDDKALRLFFARLKDIQARTMGATIRLEIKTEDDKLKP
jgi:hypothetical protein